MSLHEKAEKFAWSYFRRFIPDLRPWNGCAEIPESLFAWLDSHITFCFFPRWQTIRSRIWKAGTPAEWCAPVCPDCGNVHALKTTWVGMLALGLRLWSSERWSQESFRMQCATQEVSTLTPSDDYSLLIRSYRMLQPSPSYY